MSIYEKLFPPRELELSSGEKIKEPRSRTLWILLLLAAAMVVSAKVTGFDLATILERGEQFFVIVGQMFPPKWSYRNRILSPLLDTIKMSLLGSAIGSLLVVPFSVIASSNIVKNRGILFAVRLFLSIVRTLPTLVSALIATYMFGFGMFAGTFAIAVFTFAYVGKQLYELDRHPAAGDAGVSFDLFVLF